VEDQKKTAGFVRKALQAQGFAADVCANGDDALVLGIMIPGRDGLSVLRQLRDRLAGQLDEIQRLAKIVDGLTLLTKADAGLVELKREPVALDKALREVVADAQILARPSELSVTLTGCVPVRLLGDKHRLR
jgi:signal transduction histidine kinase